MTADELLALVDPTEGTTDELAWRLRDALAVQDQIKDVVDALMLDLDARLETDTQVVPNLGALRRVRTKSRVWRDEQASVDFRADVFKAIEDEVAVDKVSGERDVMRANIARLVTRELDLALPAFTSIKAAGKARLRIDVDEYRVARETTKVVLDTGLADHA